MALRSVEILIAENREAKKILGSLGALMGGFAVASDAPELSNPNSANKKERTKQNANQRHQDGRRTRRGSAQRHPAV